MKKPERFAGGDFWYKLGEFLGNLSGKMLLWSARAYHRSSDSRGQERIEEILILMTIAVDEFGWTYEED